MAESDDDIAPEVWPADSYSMVGDWEKHFASLDASKVRTWGTFELSKVEYR